MTSATDSGQWRPSDTLANRLRLVRGELGLSQREAADRAGITARVWQNAEDGRTIRSERAVLAAIALAFNLDREWLAWGGALNGETPTGNDPDGGNVADLTSRQTPNAKKPSWFINRECHLAAVA